MRTLHVVYRDASKASFPVVPWFKLRAKRGVIAVTFSDGSRGIVPVDAVALARVEERGEEA